MSSSFFDRLNEIDDRTRYGVYGWIRRASSELELGHIPLRIQSICILYFAVDERFEIIGRDIKLSNDNMTATKNSDSISSWKSMTYGAKEIQSKNDCIYIWEFTISSLYGHAIVIGISNKQRPNEQLHQTPMPYGEYTYGYCSDGDRFGGKYWGFGEHYTMIENGDKVTMELDLVEGRLIFYINDKHKIVIEDIKKSDHIKYRMLVSICNPGESVQILQFYTK